MKTINILRSDLVPRTSYLVPRAILSPLTSYLLPLILFLACSCSSSEEETTNNEEQPQQQWLGSTFSQSERPVWAIDWSSDATTPEWESPDPTKFDCNMTMLVELSREALENSTDKDMMAIFINDECRGVSYPNKLPDSKVVFLLYVKGTSDEANHPMELRYYCDALHHLTITNAVSPFKPNNLFDETYRIAFNIDYGSTKYPLFTSLTVILPQKLPFTVDGKDMMAVFVGNECRGIGSQAPELYEGWRMNVFSRQADETAQLRYYSAQQGGTYTILKTFKLTGDLQLENISF